MRSLLVLLFLCASAQAQTTYYKDQYGMPSGYSRQTGNTTYYYNGSGQQSYSTRQSGQTTTYYNNSQRPFGSEQTYGYTPSYVPDMQHRVRDNGVDRNPYAQQQLDLYNSQLRAMWMRQYGGRRW